MAQNLRCFLGALCLLGGAVVVALPAAAQETPTAPPISQTTTGAAPMVSAPAPVSVPLSQAVAPRGHFVLLHPDRLYAESAFGRRVQAELKVFAQEIQAENGALTRDLEAEELTLLQKRETLSPTAFRDLADAFDEKVQLIRAAQERKGQELNARAVAGRQAFNDASIPVLHTILEERGAVGIIDSRVVLLSAASIDITNEAILRVDQTLGDGL
jgi:Skp family chaperone for outer membrane proteins